MSIHARVQAIQGKGAPHKAYIDSLYEEASNTLLEEIERLARKILKERKGFDEFIMGMGTIFFTSKKENNFYRDIIDLSDYKYLSPLKDLIDEYDNDYHLTGEPMRFTANGKKITNW